MRPLLVLRPEPGAMRTAAQAERLGLSVELHPLFAIEPVGWSLPPGRFDGLLLTSANAVRMAGSLPRLPVHAVGEATATAARAAGATVMAAGTSGVDDLLAATDPGLHLLHLAGEERMAPARPVPRVTAVTVYRALALPLPTPPQVEGRVVLIHSPAAGRRLAEVRCDRSQVRIAAISAAAAVACGTGWQACAAAARPDDDSLLSLARRLCEEMPT